MGRNEIHDESKYEWYEFNPLGDFGMEAPYKPIEFVEFFPEIYGRTYIKAQRLEGTYTVSRPSIFPVVDNIAQEYYNSYYANDSSALNSLNLSTSTSSTSATITGDISATITGNTSETISSVSNESIFWNPNVNLRRNRNR